MLRLSADTSPEAEEIQIELLRQATIAHRFRLVRSLSSTTRFLAWQGLRQANPTLSDIEIDLLFVHHHYGAELANSLRQYLNERAQSKLLIQAKDIE